ncbi:MAG TPA: helical backbone metal receptor [Solirubrobacterales bacterium]|nr:helical backbone metal receptor [Solirubrobacterales bacterium]
MPVIERQNATSAEEARIVCLVPSITELICELGLAAQLVGRTGFCIHPWETVRRIPKVGGTKDVKLERVRELAPTHVVVNVDENLKEDAEALAEFGVEVVITHPQRPRDNLGLYRQLGGLFDREAEAERLCAEFERAYARATAAEHPPREVLYLIWRDPWMTVAPDTYIAQTLALFGWHTLPPSDVVEVRGLYGTKAQPQRYPEVDLGDFAGRVDRVLLSSEPFHFKQRHLAEVEGLVPGAEVSLIDGEMTSWYGSRAIAGLDYLAEYTVEAVA